MINADMLVEAESIFMCFVAPDEVLGRSAPPSPDVCDMEAGGELGGGVELEVVGEASIPLKHFPLQSNVAQLPLSRLGQSWATASLQTVHL